MASSKETILWGAWIDESGGGGSSYGGGGVIAGSALATFEANMGKQCSIVHFNNGNWMSNGSTVAFSSTNLDRLTSAGRLPMIEWNPWDQQGQGNTFSLRVNRIAAGDWDSYITTYATACKTWGKPMLIRTMLEMNQTAFVWGYGDDTGVSVTYGGHTWVNTLADYLAAWRRIVGIFRSVGASNVKFVWCPNTRGTTGVGSVLTYAQQYPGSEYVDWLGMDGYPYQSNMTSANEFKGTGGFGFQDSYTQMAALDSALPMMICETGWLDSPAGLAISSITTNGTTWTVTMPSGTWLPNNGLRITSANPSAYNGQYTIASAAGQVITINNTATPAAFVSGTGQLQDRINKATALTQSFEIDIPTTMPRLKAVVLFWTLPWSMTWDGTQNTGVDFVALKNAIGNAHYLAGGNITSDLAAKSFVPFQDQPLVSPNERYRGVLKSTTGLVGLWLLNDSAGPAADDSGNGRTASVVGTAALAATNVIPAEPTWTSATFPGTVGNNLTVATNAAFSPATNNHLTIETSFVIPTTPTVQSAVVSKAWFSGGNFYEWTLFVSPTQTGFTLSQAAGTTYSSWTTGLVSLNVPHHLLISIDLTNATNPFFAYLDGGAGQGSSAASGSMVAGTSPVMFGQRADGSAPLPANSRVGPTAIYSTTLTAESAGDHYAAWAASPVLSAFSAVPATGVVSYTSDVIASTQIEYGLTTGYGSLTPYANQRVTSHGATLSSLAPATLYHYRGRSRNQMGTETLGTDQTFTTLAALSSLGIYESNEPWL